MSWRIVIAVGFIFYSSNVIALNYTDDTPFLSPNVEDTRPLIFSMNLDTPHVVPIKETRKIMKPLCEEANVSKTIIVETKKQPVFKNKDENIIFVPKEILVKEEKKAHEEIKVEDEATNFFNTLNKEKKKPINMEK
jgi:hypothetical protein